MDTDNNSQIPKKRYSNIFYIGLLSFFGGISQDIFLPVLPLYLANTLGLDKTVIGLAEGLVTSGASIFKAVSGFLVDKFGRKKPFIFAGYFISLIARPLLALVSGAPAILGLRFLDGVGKGIKDPPKDALIADSTQITSRGRGFGIVRMLDTLGSVAGPLLLFLLFYFLKDNSFSYHLILFIAAIPLLITLTILKIKVHEVSTVNKEKTIMPKLKLPRQFYFFLGIVVLFGIGNFSDAFIILQARNVGVAVLAIPLVYAIFNFVYATASVPLGSLSDRIGRPKVIMLGWFAFALSYLGFALAKESYQIWLLFAFYGLYYATTEGVAKAFIADMVSSDHRGRAYGVYNTAIGLIGLPASFIAGILWDRISPSAPFYFGFAIAILAILAFGMFTFLTRKLAIKN